jgi:hypothetical protein
MTVWGVHRQRKSYREYGDNCVRLVGLITYKSVMTRQDGFALK